MAKGFVKQQHSNDGLEDTQTPLTQEQRVRHAIHPDSGGMFSRADHARCKRKKKEKNQNVVEPSVGINFKWVKIKKFNRIHAWSH